MFNNIIHQIELGFVTAGIIVGSWFGFVPENQIRATYDARISQLEAKLDETKTDLKLGAFNVTGGGTYRLKSSVGLSDATINLSSFKEPVSNIKYTMSYMNTSVAYGTIDPQTTRSEFVSFTGITQNSDGSAQLTGVSRGLTRTPAGSTCTASTTLAQRHAGQSIFILSDSPCLFAQYAVKQNDEAVTGLWTVPDPVSAQGIASRNYVDGRALGGIGNATETATGTVEMATQLEAASSTSSGTLGRLVIGANLSTSTYNSATAPLRVTVTQNSGQLDGRFIFGSAAPVNLATTTFLNPNILLGTGTTTIVGSTTISSCISCGNSTIYVPATQFASTTNPTFGVTGGFFGRTATSTYFVMLDADDGQFAVAAQVPKGVTRLTGIKIIYSQRSTSNVTLAVNTSYASSTYPTTPELDSDSSTAYAGGGTDNRTNAISLVSTAFDGLGSVTGGGVINLQVARNAGTGSDTYTGSFIVYGVEFIFN